MKVATVLSLLATCAAVDYRPGCMTLPKKRHFDNDMCVERIGEAMQSDFAFRIVVDEQNVFVWNEILALANKYDYEFSKSYKTTQALQRVAKNVAATMKDWAEAGANYGAQLGFAACFATQLLDNENCGLGGLCHIKEAVMDGWQCAALGYFQGGLAGGVLGVGVGLGKGLIEAYEENGQIHVKFKPAGGEF